MAALEDKLVQYIDEAFAMEQNVLRMLDGMIGSTDDAQMKRLLERHRKETVRQAERLEGCLSAHGATPSKVKQAGGVVGAVVPTSAANRAPLSLHAIVPPSFWNNRAHDLAASMARGTGATRTLPAY